ncbi:MAG: hypothetical protein OXM87_05230 [Truepera sp.]|nr:hypothetical protein [Truepera sp.]
MVRGDFLRGFGSMIPLWVGVAPFGLAYAVSARSAGLSLLEAQLMSLVSSPEAPSSAPQDYS